MIHKSAIDFSNVLESIICYTDRIIFYLY